MSSETVWYLLRTTGIVSLLMLTIVMVLGMLTAVNWQPPFLPRFVVQGIHRSIALASLIFLGIHILSAVTDSYVAVSLADVLIPFRSSYEPLFLGFGAVAIDLVVALIVTSLLRDHIGARLWKAIHWAAYGFWPVAMTHAIGIGTDSAKVWMLALYGFELVLVGITLAIRRHTRFDANDLAQRALTSQTRSV